MPYYESPYGTGRWRYFDPIKAPEEIGLRSVAIPIFDEVTRGPNLWDWEDKYELFARYPMLEQLDYSRLIFEKSNGIDTGNPCVCCYPWPCVLCAAIGCSMHWDWRAYFSKKMPYWTKDISVP